MRLVISVGILWSWLAIPVFAQSPEVQRALERAILKELIEVNTSDSAGHTPELAAAIATRLKAAGFPANDVTVLGHHPRYQGLVARYRGRASGKKPIMLMAHLDVVDARKEDWSFNRKSTSRVVASSVRHSMPRD